MHNNTLLNHFDIKTSTKGPTFCTWQIFIHFHSPNLWNLMKISLKYDSIGQTVTMSGLVQVMSWRLMSGTKPLPEPMLIVDKDHMLAVGHNEWKWFIQSSLCWCFYCQCSWDQVSMHGVAVEPENTLSSINPSMDTWFRTWPNIVVSMLAFKKGYF